MPERRNRYALYFAPPPESALWATGCAWLGYDAGTGETVPRPPAPGLAEADITAMTAKAAFYGFHATLKAPFSLAASRSEGELLDFAAGFAASRPHFAIPRLDIATLGDFIALRPTAAVPALDRLAADCVEAFDAFRAPPAPEALAKRRDAGLTPRQEALLIRWGYPYVMTEYRFHMTLTDGLPEGERPTVTEILRRLFGEALSAPVPVDGIAVFVQPEPAARFRILRRFAFARC